MNISSDESVPPFYPSKAHGNNSLDFLLKFNLFLIFAVLIGGGVFILRGNRTDEVLQTGEEVEVVEKDTPETMVINADMPKVCITDQDDSPKVTGDVTVLFGGDLMMDRYIRQVAEKEGYDYILEDLKPVLDSADLIVVNLEGPITEYASVSAYSEIGSTNNYIFTMDAEVVRTLLNNNIGIVNKGNNHILNFGLEGLNYTGSMLAAGNIDSFGFTGTEPEDSCTTYLVTDRKSTRLGFVNYNQFVEKGLERALEDIKEIRPAVDYLVLYAHWGVEYADVIATSQREVAYSFIDAGADVVIGSHPHVVQETEIYSGKKIFYSLGNFVFDQYLVPETQRGLMVKMVIDENSKRAEFSELELVLTPDGKTSFNTIN